MAVAGCCCFIVVMRQNIIFNGVKMSNKNIFNTVMCGQGLSSQLRSVRKKPGRGIHLNSQFKNILTSVRSYFEEEKRTGKSLIRNRPLDRTAMQQEFSRLQLNESTRL